MNTRSSWTSLFLPPTSPISAPTETVTPSGSRSRMNLVVSAARSKLTRCCSSSVGCDRSTSVDVSTSML